MLADLVLIILLLVVVVAASDEFKNLHRRIETLEKLEKNNGEHKLD